MTHSGGKTHDNIGDRGQRYEIHATGHPKPGPNVIGWSDDLASARYVAGLFRQAPGCTDTSVFDRQGNSLVTDATATAPRI